MISEPWFRVHANIGSRRVVWRLMAAGNVGKAQAIGHLAAFWGQLSQHCPGGVIADVPDAILEEWGAWEGPRGVFARFVREQHSTEGRVNDYAEYSGKLDSHRAKTRERVQRWRKEQPGNALQDPLRNALRNADVTAHETRRDEITTSPSPSAGAGAREGIASDQSFGESSVLPAEDRAPPQVITALLDRIPPEGQESVRELLRSVPHAERWAAECTGALDGIRDVQLTPQQLTAACGDFLGNGAEKSLGLFRGYLRRAADGADKPPPSPPNGQLRGARHGRGAARMPEMPEIPAVLPADLTPDELEVIRRARHPSGAPGDATYRTMADMILRGDRRGDPRGDR